MQALGIDIGGSGVKGAQVDITTGQLLTDRYRVPTPQPATPEAVVGIIADIVHYHNWEGVMGVGYPGVVKNGVTLTAANVDDGWIGYDLQQGLERVTGGAVRVLNDADAAGVAEMSFGAGKDQKGMVVIVTLGTGIGVAAFIDGKLVPNLELGHIKMNGTDAETLAAESARERDELSWKKWTKRVDSYLSYLEQLLNPDLFIIGGGVSKKWHKFIPHFEKTSVEVVPAQLRNQAGIVGAALSAVEYDL